MSERLLYPAIDLLGGQHMRALRDNDGVLALTMDDPIATALRWRDQGAQWLHLVDLDGAREGAPRQLETIHAIIQATGLPAQMAGGLRDAASVEAALAAGAARVVLSAATPDDQALVADCVTRWGERIAVALEARDGWVTVAGWLPSDAATALDVARAMDYLGVETLLFTSATSGGESDPLPEALRRALPGMRLIAGGAISSLDDLRQLFTLGMNGVLLGRALYAGLFTLEEAQAVVRDMGEIIRISVPSQEDPQRGDTSAGVAFPDGAGAISAIASLEAMEAQAPQPPIEGVEALELTKTQKIATLTALSQSDQSTPTSEGTPDKGTAHSDAPDSGRDRDNSVV